MNFDTQRIVDIMKILMKNNFYFLVEEKKTISNFINKKNEDELSIEEIDKILKIIRKIENKLDILTNPENKIYEEAKEELTVNDKIKLDLRNSRFDPNIYIDIIIPDFDEKNPFNELVYEYESRELVPNDIHITMNNEQKKDIKNLIKAQKLSAKEIEYLENKIEVLKNLSEIQNTSINGKIYLENLKKYLKTLKNQKEALKSSRKLSNDEREEILNYLKNNPEKEVIIKFTYTDKFKPLDIPLSFYTQKIGNRKYLYEYNPVTKEINKIGKEKLEKILTNYYIDKNFKLKFENNLNNNLKM